MKIKRIRFKNIRFFGTNELTEDGCFGVDLAETISVFIGPNGSGKTSILEGIAFLTFGYDKRFTEECRLRQTYSPYRSDTFLEVTLHSDSDTLTLTYIGEEYATFFSLPDKSDVITTSSYANTAYRLALQQIVINGDKVETPLSIDDFLLDDRECMKKLLVAEGVREYAAVLVDFHLNSWQSYLNADSLRQFLDDKNRAIPTVAEDLTLGFHALNKDKALRMLREHFAQDIFYDTIPNKGTTNKTNFIRRVGGQELVYPANLEASGVGWLAVVLLTVSAREGRFLLIDEPESHLHPLFQRKLIHLLTAHNCQIALSTHSATMINGVMKTESGAVFSTSLNRIMQQNGGLSEIVSSIGIQPSDVLLSNGIVFVEGVSDRMYLRRWISLYCQESGIPEPLEGVDYTFLEYGGCCLSHFSFTEINYDELKSQDIDSLIPVLSLTHKYFVIMDRDRDSPEVNLAASKSRVIQETNEKDGCGVWVTDGREIENYLPESVHLVNPVGVYSSLPRLFHQKFNQELNKRKYAEGSCLKLNSNNWAERDGLRDHIAELIQCIKSWNE